jgi:hypothetical protein
MQYWAVALLEGEHHVSPIKPTFSSFRRRHVWGAFFASLERGICRLGVHQEGDRGLGDAQGVICPVGLGHANRISAATRRVGHAFTRRALARWEILY